MEEAPKIDMDAFRQEIQDAKTSSDDPHWEDIDPAELDDEDAHWWKRVHERTVNIQELRVVNQEKTRNLSMSDTKANFYAYLVNLLLEEWSEGELARMDAKDTKKQL